MTNTFLLKNQNFIAAFLLAVALFFLFSLFGNGLAIVKMGPMGIYSTFMNALLAPSPLDHGPAEAGRVIIHLLTIVYYVIAIGAIYYLLKPKFDAHISKLVYAAGVLLAIILFYNEVAGLGYFNYSISANWQWLFIRLFSIGATFWAAHVLSQKKSNKKK